MAISVERIRKELSDRIWLDSLMADANEQSSSKREMLWDLFANHVADHVANYTVPQYGDFPDDNVNKMSVETLQEQIKKYTARFGTNARGKEDQLLDLIKIAHYASIIWCREVGFEEQLATYEDWKELIPTYQEMNEAEEQATSKEQN